MAKTRLLPAALLAPLIVVTTVAVVPLLQAHAEVVSAFLANGRSEMMKNHPLPPRNQP